MMAPLSTEWISIRGEGVMERKRLLVIQVAGLGDELVRRHKLSCRGRAYHAMETVFPALTCPAQASFRTAQPPSAHGVLANGLYQRELRRALFWEQSSALVTGPRIWDGFRSRGGSVAMLFWQQSLGEDADIILSPAPIHKHNGGMIEDCYSQPAGLYARLCHDVGRPFRLRDYWGPLASVRSSQWIAEATAALLRTPDLAPDICLTYLPALDYQLQRHGPASAAAKRAVAALICQLEGLTAAAEAVGYDWLVFGDYAIASCQNGAVLPNRALLDAGLLTARRVSGRLYPDFHASRAFALCDHETAQVYVHQAGDITAVRTVLAALSGVEGVFGPDEQAARGIRHAQAGELTLLAADGFWLAYPWWRTRAEAPDYAGHVDIHNKPGYDPCELFFGWPPGTVSLETSRIRGSHGRVGGDARRVGWASTLDLQEPSDVIALAARIRTWLDNNA